jgi:hypothetical protein
MSNMPRCQRCGKYIYHGPVICDNCLQSVLDEIDKHLIRAVGTQWTYAKDIMSVVRDAFQCELQPATDRNGIRKGGA